MNNLRLPVKHDLKLVYASSLAVAAIMAIVSIAGILYWSLIYPAPQAASSVGSDVFNLVVVLPILLISMWLAHRGSLIGLLFWPGALFYVLYIYTYYVIGVIPLALLAFFLKVKPRAAARRQRSFHSQAEYERR
jgi:hypothetical protein